MLVNAFGNGMVLPFLVIYLHNVCGLGLGTAGLAVGTYGAFGLAGTFTGGALSDRIGPHRTLVYALGLSAVGYGLLPLVARPWHAFVFLAVAGLGNGAFWPPHSSLIVGHTPEDRRHAAFAVNRIALNLGIGVGGLVGGLVATTGSRPTFTTLFVVDALTFVAFAAMLALVPRLPRAPRAERAPGRYADVLRDRVYVAFVALNALFVIVAMAQLETALPAFAKNDAGVSEKTIGALFAVNVAVIVLLQMPIVRALRGRNRMRILAAMSLLWGLCWVGTLGSGLLLSGALAGAALFLVIGVFALGECMHAPTQGGLIADLAKPEARGRYFAFSTASYAIGFTLGPALGGFALGLSPAALWAPAAALCVVAAAACLALDRRLPAAARVYPA
jgi:predicted MFS family arabinose efflux permease